MIGVNNFSRSKINLVGIEKTVSKILKILGKPRVLSPEIYFVGPKKMAELHEKYLKKPGPTTVISLEASKNFPIGNLKSLGEIYLCPSEVRKSGLVMEYFLVHGLLHLCGHDHKNAKQEKVMLAKEKEICDKMRI